MVDKKTILILGLVLLSLGGIIFILFSLFSKPEEVIFNEEEEVNVIQEINDELFKIRNILENDIALFNKNPEVLNIVEKLKELGSRNIVSNIDSKNQLYCFALTNDGKSFCVDNNFIGDIDVFYCNKDNASCAMSTIEEEIEEIEEIEEVMFVLKEEALIKDTEILIYEKRDGGVIVIIDDEEFGPYSEADLVYNEAEWGVLMSYNQKWYVNINGKARGPYLKKPVMEFYEDNLGFSFEKDNKYYVILMDQVYGPYDDLLEFDINEK